MIFKGVIHSIGATRQPSEKFKVREAILDMTEEINGRPNPWYLGFQMTQEKCQLLDNFKVGDSVQIDASVGTFQTAQKDGKEVCYNNVTAWRIKSAEADKNVNPAADVPPAQGEAAPW